MDSGSLSVSARRMIRGRPFSRKALVSGRFLETGEKDSAVIDLSFARNSKLGIGETLKIQDSTFSIVGVVDSSRISRLATAQVYISLASAREIAAHSSGVKAVHTFGKHDSNLLFIRADRDRSDEIGKQIKETMGDTATVSTPASFQEMLGSVFVLTDRFSLAVSLLSLLVAFLLVARTTASNVRERRPEIGTMKAVGWTRVDILGQLGSETLIMIVIGMLGGLVLGFVAAKALSLVTISIPIPWEMSPRPHFMPGGGDQLTRDVRLNVSISPVLMASAFFASLVIGIGSAWAMARSITNLKPSEVLRYE